MKSKRAKPEADVEVVGAFEAKTHLSSLLRKARAGRRIVITQRGTPVAQLIQIDPQPLTKKQKSLRGDMKGKIWISDDFCDDIEEMREYMP